MTAVIHKISVGARGKHTLSPEESLRRSVSFGNIMRALCAVIRPDHFKLASYGPVPGGKELYCAQWRQLFYTGLTALKSISPGTRT